MNNSLSKKPFFIYTTLASVAIPIACSVLLLVGFPDWRWENEQVHVSIEVLGTFTALSLAAIFLLLEKPSGDNAHHLWVACAMISMGILDFAHVLNRQPDIFVYLRSMAALTGGFLFSLVWLPARTVSPKSWKALPLVVIAAAMVNSIFIIALPQMKQLMLLEGAFTNTAKIINLLGGSLFILAAVRLNVLYLRNKRPEDLLLANLSILFGGAGLLFSLSALWSAIWWFWHLLRLAAYFLILLFVFINYKRVTEDLLKARENLELKVEALRASEAELHDNYFAQATINMILSESMENIPLEEILQKSLNMILAVPWIAFEPVGSIHLVEDDPEILVMKARYNLPESQINVCAHIPFGKCLCGQAALTQKIQFADHIDERHEIWYDGMPPHGHYVAPILFGGRTLGVLNIYLKEGHIRDKKEEEFFRNIADTLAGIISRKKAEDRIEYLAYYDNLTGLPNRNLFIDRLTQGIARAGYRKKFVAVLTIDIDRFKFINDTYGLDTGDAVLKAVAERLAVSVREGDTAARIGGDDFGVMLIDIAQPEDIVLVVEKIMKNVSQPIQFKGKEIVLTVSAGISVHPQDGNDASSLIKNATMALAKAKQQGRKTCQFYTEDMDIKASEFVLMEKSLFNAIKNEEFILHYQPYWDINTKKITGMEALIRWQCPELGLVSPGKFIPVLEDTRMIIEVGEWVLRTAIRQVKEWQNKGYPVVPVSVNLSLIQFRQKDISQMIERIIRETRFYPSFLTLEITESAFMHDIEFTYSVLERLKKIGVSISIDDFGTGYSSLAHLKRFPIDTLKIDMSFIREIATDTDTASIVTAIINMAHTLNLKTIAEGIETEEQWKILRLLRCDMGQGFYLSKPLPAEEIAMFFKQE